MKLPGVLCLALLLSACASTDVRPQLERGLGGVPATQFSNANTVEAIRALQPQATVPLSVAVMPPSGWAGLSQEERAVVEKWGRELKSIGFIRSLEIIPRTLAPTCGYRSDSGCFLEQARAAGARLGADTILFLNHSTVTDAYANPLSILNLTIVGMWIVPAHHRESYSIYEAALFDIDNGYLYAVTEGSGRHTRVRPLIYADYRPGEKEARLKALDAVGGKLYEMAKTRLEK